jgi:hypothetical protein
LILKYKRDIKLSDYFKDTPEKRAIERSFLDGAMNALREEGVSALECLAANPGLSDIELAKRLDRGTTMRGLLMVLYDEAERAGVVRDVAKEMLIRTILTEFPDGWTRDDSVRPSVKLGSWDRLLRQCVLDPRAGLYGYQIIQELAIDNQPPEGWRVTLPKDPLIDQLFDKHWPVPYCRDSHFGSSGRNEDSNGKR